jgi:hypothetical protein
MVEGEDDEEEEVDDETADIVEQKKKQLLQQPTPSNTFNREMKALARDQEKRMTAVVSMLNFLYKAIKVRATGDAAKGKDEVLENLFNTTYDDLKYLEVLKELLQSDNGIIVCVSARELSPSP